MAPQIALWRDRFTPPRGEESDVLGRYPYLGPAFEFMEREPGTAPYMCRLHNFTFGAMVSLGITGAAITGLRYGVPRLVNGVVRDLFREDAAAHYRDLLAYAAPELETLEGAYAWIDRLAAEALGARKLIDHLERNLPNPMLDARASQSSDGKDRAALAGRPGKRLGASPPPERCATRELIRRRRTK